MKSSFSTTIIHSFLWGLFPETPADTIIQKVPYIKEYNVGYSGSSDSPYNFRISLSKVHQKTYSDFFYWDFTETVDLIGKDWCLDNIESSFIEYISIYSAIFDFVQQSFVFSSNRFCTYFIRFCLNILF